MSNNIFKIFNRFSMGLLYKKNPITSSDLTFNFLALSLSFSLNLGYSVVTEKKEEIKVAKKYKLVDYGSTNFMIVDNNGRHFNINNSLWYWKWDSVEDWEKIDKNDTISIRYYGLRVPLFGMFPNIVNSKKI